MKKIRITFAIAILLFSLSSAAQTNLVADNIELAVLKNIYDSLGGASWTTKTNWPTTWPGSATSSQFGTWYGVTVTNGDISAITFNANNLQGTIPKTIGQLGSLVTLTITSNSLLNSVIPTTIGSLTKLVTLNLAGNHLTGTIPSTVATMSAMQVFAVGQNALTGSFPSALCGLTGLHTLGLNNNLFSGPVPDAIGNMIGLSSIDIHSATFSGSIPSSIGKLTNLVILYLYGNQFSGPIPPSLGNLTSLQYLYLLSNQITGPIPVELSKLTNLKYFMLGGNQLTGQVPPELAGLTKMISFNIASNKLNGVLPPNIFAGWTQCVTINVLGNSLSGDFPSVANCTALTSVYGTTNLFTSLPASLNALGLLNYLNFSSNDIRSVPDFSMQANKAHLTLVLDNNRLDFFQLEPLYGTGILSVTTPIQKNISDISQMSVKIGSDLIVPARSRGAHSTVTWEKQQSNGTWSAVNASDADVTLATYKRSPSANADLGIYHWKMTNSVVTGVTLQSDPIEVKDLYFVALDNLGFQYRYDNKNRMTQKKVPGADWVYMVYDPHDRLALTQDGEQRKLNQWAFTKYDPINRAALTGIRDTTVLLSQAQMQTVVNAYYSKASSRWTDSVSVASTGTVHGYSNRSYPVIANPDSYLTVTYYDNYGFGASNSKLAYVASDLSNEVQNGLTYQQPALPFDFVNGKVTGTKVKILETNGRWLNTVTYYDRKYNPIQTISDNHRAGLTRQTSLFDFSGKVIKTKTTYVNQKPTWTALVGVRVDDHALTATTTTASWGANGAASVNTLAASTDGWIESTFIAANTGRAFGFSSSNTDANYTSINYAISFSNPGQPATVYENGTSKYVLSGTFINGDVFRVERTGSTISYKKNGVVFYTSLTSTSSALMVDVAMNNGGALQNMRISFAAPYSQNAFAKTLEYDHAGRLLKTWHQAGAGTKVLLAMNVYNELGQLFDKKLHNTDPTTTSDASRIFKQSIDYRYNIRGWLASMNNSKLEMNSTNDDANDLFGMNLLYDGVESGIGNTPQYNGNISVMKWNNNAATGLVKDIAYRYSYDTLNRLKGAKFLKDSTTWANPDSTFNENGFSYDRNGNIRHLKRTGKKGALMDVLSYNYATTGTLGNKLMSVTDAGLSAQGFVDGLVGADDYTYDASGSMTADKNKGASSITYNFLHLPENVTMTNSGSLQYVYDATGQKRQQLVFDKNSGLTKKADYLGEMYFENDTLKYALHDEGRIILTGTTPEYQYDLKDHLGNVRMTFTSKAEVDSALATLETAKIASEQSKFLYYNEAVKVNAPIFDHTNAGGTYYSTRLNGSTLERSGLAKSLSVMPGDTINAKVYVKYLDPDHGNWAGADLAILIASYSNPAAGTFIDGGAAGSTGGLTAPFLGQLNKAAETGTAPRAFLNYLIFDRDYHYLDGGFVRVTTDAREYGQGGPHQLLESQFVIKQPGYVYIYLSNDNVSLGGSAVEVYFDDFEVKHIMSPVVQSQDYYPFGMTFNSYARESSVANKYLFNKGSERQDDLGLNVYQTHYRMYDMALGRWWQLDPKSDEGSLVQLTPYNFSDDDPVLKNDPNGDCPWCVLGAVVGAAVGGVIEAGSQLVQDGKVSDWGAVGGAALQGGITGGIAAATGGASLLVTGASSIVANVVGGAVNNAVQGKEITVGTVAKDAAIGAGGAILGKVAGAAINKLSPMVKGQIGEAATQAKYLVKGFVSTEKAVVATGGKTATGRVQNAVYDHAMLNKATGKALTVESKFNRAGLTSNQRAAAGNVSTPGGLIVDRTTSGQVGNVAAGVVTGTTSNQINKQN